VYEDQPLSHEDRDRQVRTLVTLDGYLTGVAEFMGRNRPTPESVFALGTRENGGIWWRETGDLPLAASFDHLEAFRTLLRGPIPRQAGLSVLRGSAEAAAVAWWVFDSDATEEERVQRGFEERLLGIHSQRGLVEQNKDRLAAQHRAVVDEAAKFGLSEEPDSRAKGLTHFGRPRLGTQDLLTRMMPDTPPESKLSNGEILWRVLSAFSHSELWTNMLGLKASEDDTRSRVLSVHMPTLMRMCTLTVRAHDAAFSRRMKLAGHSTWEEERGSLPRF